MNRKELASWLNISGRTVSRWVNERELPHSHGINGELVFEEKAVREWLERGGLPEPTKRRKIKCQAKSLERD